MVEAARVVGIQFGDGIEFLRCVVLIGLSTAVSILHETVALYHFWVFLSSFKVDSLAHL